MKSNRKPLTKHRFLRWQGVEAKTAPAQATRRASEASALGSELTPPA